MRSRLSVVFAIAALAVVLLAIAASRAPAGPRSLTVFDADRLADLEIDMWQAYYAHQNLRLFGGLVTMLHEQYRYSWAKACLAGFRLARAARTFGDAASSALRIDKAAKPSVQCTSLASSFRPATIIAVPMARSIRGPPSRPRAVPQRSRAYASAVSNATRSSSG